MYINKDGTSTKTTETRALNGSTKFWFIQNKWPIGQLLYQNGPQNLSIQVNTEYFKCDLVISCQLWS